MSEGVVAQLDNLLQRLEVLRALERDAEIERLRDRVEVLEAVLHAIFPDGANIKIGPKASAEEAKP